MAGDEAANAPADLPQLHFSAKAPLLAIYAAAAITGLKLQAVADPTRTQSSQTAIELPSGEVFESVPLVLRFIARSGGRSFLYGTDPVTACQVDQWLDFSSALGPGSSLEAACTIANEYLALRTFFVGYRLSLADLACWGQLAVNMQWDKLKKSGAFPHLARWAAHLDAQPALADVAERHGPKRLKVGAERVKELAAAGRGGGGLQAPRVHSVFFRLNKSTTFRSSPAKRATMSTAVDAATKPITFYDSGTCPYAHRTWLALEEKLLPYETIKVDLQNKSKDFEDIYHTVNPDPASRAKVPIIIDGGATVTESMLTVEYLDAKYPEAGAKLFPNDPFQCFKVKFFIETFSDKASAFSLLRASTPEQLVEATEKLTSGLKVLDAFLRQHGSEEGGDYFLGGTYSAAETITTPFVRRMLVALPVLRDVDVAAIVKAEKLERLDRWFQASLERPSNKSTGPTDEAIIEGFRRFTTPIVVN